MSSPSNPLATLDARRIALGMTIDVVARRSGVSPSTVERVLSGRYGAASFETVQRIAAALGAEVRIEGVTDIVAMREAQAQWQARRLEAANRPADSTGNSADVAGAAQDEAGQAARVRQRIHKLLAGSNRKLWAE